MRVALCGIGRYKKGTNNPHVTVLADVDRYDSDAELLDALERQDYELLILPFESPLKGEVMRRLHNRDRPAMILHPSLVRKKYVGWFNGKVRIVDIQDICFFESFQRKTSVVTDTDRFRIRAKLKEEEQKLPEDQFARINQWNIVNMQQIYSLRENELRIKNGAKLYVSRGYWKTFLSKYEKYMYENDMILQNPQ